MQGRCSQLFWVSGRPPAFPRAPVTHLCSLPGPWLGQQGVGPSAITSARPCGTGGLTVVGPAGRCDEEPHAGQGAVGLPAPRSTHSQQGRSVLRAAPPPQSMRAGSSRLLLSKTVALTRVCLFCPAVASSLVCWHRSLSASADAPVVDDEPHLLPLDAGAGHLHFSPRVTPSPRPPLRAPHMLAPTGCTRFGLCHWPSCPCRLEPTQCANQRLCAETQGVRCSLVFLTQTLAWGKKSIRPLVSVAPAGGVASLLHQGHRSGAPGGSPLRDTVCRRQALRQSRRLRPGRPHVRGPRAGPASLSVKRVTL